MNSNDLIQQLAANSERIRQLTSDVLESQARWKPDEQSWSILEVVNHLYDEERLDFRHHLDFTLHPTGEPWRMNNPLAWVQERQYNERDLRDSLEGFLAERRESLGWLRDLSNPYWDATALTPFGLIRAGDILASWAAHDLLHLRQLVELHLGYLRQEAEPYQTDYAEG